MDSDRKGYVHMATKAVEVEVAAKSTRPTLRERLDMGSGYTPYILVLPTIIVTGSSESLLEQEAIRAGAVACLHKPLDSRVLLATIERAIHVQNTSP